MGLFLSPSVFYKYGETLVKIYTIIPIVLLLYVAEDIALVYKSFIALWPSGWTQHEKNCL